jgi:hypothetical protein
MADTIRVYPLSEVVKGHLDLFKHPAGNMPLRADGSDWPLDEFTSRRLRDGDITDQAPTAPVLGPPDD